MLKKELEIELKKKELEILRMEKQISNLEENIKLRDMRDELVKNEYKKKMDTHASRVVLLIKALQILQERVDFDNEMFYKLKNYLIQTFPNRVSDNKNSNNITNLYNQDLSDITLDENGKLISKLHIIDITVQLMTDMINKLNSDYDVE